MRRLDLPAKTVLLTGTILLLFTGAARPGDWRSHIHVGPPRDDEPPIPGSFNQWFPPDYGPYPAEWYHWPTLREALDQYGWFGRRACGGGPRGPVAGPPADGVPGEPVASGGPAILRVLVPADAEIWFDGGPTTQSGPQRLFETPALAGDRTYTYEVRVRWRDGGQEMSQTRTVQVSAGDRLTVDFRTAPAEIAAPVRGTADRRAP
jgi:uncharacterized protein (TIGR03000 family)